MAKGLRRWFVFWPHLVFLLALAFFFRRELFHGEMFYLGDCLTQNYPFKAYFKESIANGLLPLWAPYLNAGYPFLAQGEVGALYPLHWLTFPFLSLFNAYKVNLLLHFAIAFYGVYFYTRQLGFRCESSLASGLIFAFSGFSVALLGNINMLSTVFWLPYVLYFTDRYLEGRGTSAVNLVAVALLFALQVSCGYPQYLYYSVLFALAYLVSGLVTRKGLKLKFDPKGISKLLLFLFALGFSLALAASQLLPSLELSVSQVSGTGRLARQVVGSQFYSALELANQFFPSYYRLTYVGVLPLFLLPLAVLARGKRMAFHKGMLLCVFLMMLEPINLGSSPLMWLATLGGMFRQAIRLAPYAVLSLAVLSGWGLAAYLGGRGEKGRRAPAVAPESACRQTGAGTVAGKGGWVPIVIGILLALSAMVIYIVVYGQATGGGAWHLGLIAACLLVVCLAQWRSRTRKRLAWLGLAVLVLDLLAFSGGRTGFCTEADTRAGESTARVVRESGYRSFTIHYKWPEASLQGLAYNTPMLYRARAFNGYKALEVRRADEYKHLLVGLLESGNQRAEALRAAHDLMRAANIGYFISKFSYPAGIYLVDASLPRAFFASRFARTENKLTALKMLMSGEHRAEFYESLVLPLLAPDEADGGGGVIVLRAEGKATLAERTPHDLLLEAKALRPGYLVLSDTYYPGWRAYVDGERVDIERANYLFRAVRVGKGEHEVRFLYRPASFLCGLFLSLVASLFVAGYCGWRLVSYRQHSVR